MGAQEQPAPPAWLESLRSSMGDQPAAPENAATNFQASDLIDDTALPGWLQAAQGEMGAISPSNASGVLRSAGQGAPNTDENYLAQRGMSANSLVDQQSLPSWMRQEQQGGFGEAQRNIPAASLIQPDSVPDWMKTIQPSNNAQNNQQPAAALVTDPFNQSPAVAKGFSAQDLIDPNALPSWMTQGKSQAGPKTPDQGGPFSASSLVDESVLPSWMRQADQGYKQGAAQPQSGAWSAPASPPPQAQQPWQSPPQGGATWQPAQPSQGQPSGPLQSNSGRQPSVGVPPNHPFSASSLVDVNALPPWLRPDDAQRPEYYNGQTTRQAGNGEGQQRPAYGVPPRVDNVRVPSRPRGEVPTEGTEVAANAFASMLGVASTVPNFPLHGQQGPQGPQGVPAGQGVQGLPPYQGQQSGPMNMPPSIGMGGGPVQGMPQGFGGYPPQQPPQGTMPANQPPMQQGYAQGGYNNYAAQGNYPPMGVPPTLAGGSQGAGNGYNPMQNPQGMGNVSMPGEQQANMKPAKRGIFEVIRGWFIRS